MRKALRPGIDLSEHAVGTSAMAVAMAESQPISIDCEEHFFAQNHAFQCVAAPIFDHLGEVIGSIDLSRDAQGQHCTALSMVASCAALIETALFVQMPAFATVRLHWAGSMSAAGQADALLSFGSDGTIQATNAGCRALLGLSAPMTGMRFEQQFCGRFGDFASALRTARAPVALHLHNGLTLYASAVKSLDSRGNTKRILPDAEIPKPAPYAQPYAEDFGDDDISALLMKAERALAADLPVLITGETGTGKEVAARALHERSKHHRGPFVAINCAAIPKELIEGELFGYSDGAFTGARRGGAKGKIEEANHGTLFLDEIGDMPLELQSRLLRVLDRREVTRLGGGGTYKVQFQLICATHRDMRRLIEAGQFREDLYFRIDGLALMLPPLRSRKHIGRLVSQLNAEEGIVSPPLSRAVRDALLRYQWPGNVRELRYALRYIKAMSAGDEQIAFEHLPDRVRQDIETTVGNTAQADNKAVPLLKDLTARTTDEALKNFNGNITLAAQHLGVSRSTLHRWLKRK